MSDVLWVILWIAVAMALIKLHTAFWTNFEWGPAIEVGMAAAGYDYSGEYDFVDTHMYWPITHMVAPAEDAVACAIRETEEELGLTLEDLRVLGRLSDLHVPVSGFRVRPVVAAIPPQWVAAGQSLSFTVTGSDPDGDALSFNIDYSPDNGATWELVVYGITGNSIQIGRFRQELQRAWRRWLNRRSQKTSYTWEGFEEYLKYYPLPEPRIVYHLYTLSLKECFVFQKKDKLFVRNRDRQ